ARVRDVRPGRRGPRVPGPHDPRAGAPRRRGRVDRRLPRPGPVRRVRAPGRAPAGPGMTSARGLLRWQLQVAHDLLDGAIAPLSPEAVRRRPAGPAARAAACYAGVLLSEDLIVNGVLAAGRPLALSTWAGRTGVSELPPLTAQIDWRGWVG